MARIGLNDFRLIAHRGVMAHWPENTLPAFAAAIDAGADAIELDIQLSSDAVPMVFHDPELNRMCDLPGTIFATHSRQLRQSSAHDPGRFGSRFVGTRIPTLSDVVSLLNGYSHVSLFVELKRHSLAHFGIEFVVDRVLQDLEAARFPWIVISYVAEALTVCRQRNTHPIGWVLRRFDAASLQQALTIQPEFLFADVQDLEASSEPLPTGSWEWAVFDVTDPAVAARVARRGAAWIESADPARLKTVGR